MMNIHIVVFSSLVHGYQHFGGTYCLYFQGRTSTSLPYDMVPFYYGLFSDIPTQ
jgi:hypothetical protein